MNLISSKQNTKIKFLLNLKDRKERDETGLFVVEGFRETQRAIHAGKDVYEFYFCLDLIGAKIESLIESLGAKNSRISYLSKDLFKKISYRESPDGVLAILKTWECALKDLAASPSFFIIAENIEKPGNLGALIRSAEGAGVDALILCDTIVDVYNPNCVRASQGALFKLPIIKESKENIVAYLHAHKIQVVAMSPSATQNYWDVDFSLATAIVVGNEHAGLSDFWDFSKVVKIPMRGMSDSLNVHTAAVLTMYELVRQRSI